MFLVRVVGVTARIIFSSFLCLGCKRGSNYRMETAWPIFLSWSDHTPPHCSPSHPHRGRRGGGDVTHEHVTCCSTSMKSRSVFSSCTIEPELVYNTEVRLWWMTFLELAPKNGLSFLMSFLTYRKSTQPYTSHSHPANVKPHGTFSSWMPGEEDSVGWKPQVVGSLLPLRRGWISFVSFLSFSPKLFIITCSPPSFNLHPTLTNTPSFYWHPVSHLAVFIEANQFIVSL